MNIEKLAEIVFSDPSGDRRREAQAVLDKCLPVIDEVLPEHEKSPSEMLRYCMTVINETDSMYCKLYVMNYMHTLLGKNPNVISQSLRLELLPSIIRYHGEGKAIANSVLLTATARLLATITRFVILEVGNLYAMFEVDKHGLELVSCYIGAMDHISKFETLERGIQRLHQLQACTGIHPATLPSCCPTIFRWHQVCRATRQR